MLITMQHGYYILNNNLNVTKKHKNIGNFPLNAFGIPLNADSVLFQIGHNPSGYHYVMTDIASNAEYFPSLPIPNPSQTYDFSDSSFCVLDISNGDLYYLRKKGLSIIDSINIDGLSNFKVRKLKLEHDGVLTSSMSGSFAYIKSKTKQVQFIDSVIAKPMGGTFSQSFDMSGSVLAFATNISHCLQTHLETFSLNGARTAITARANPFGNISLRAENLQAQLVGPAEME